MDCNELKALWADEWAGTIGPDDRVRLLAHREECAACREEFDGLRGTWEALGEVETPLPSAAMVERFSAVLAGYKSAAGAPQPWRGGSLARWAVRPELAAAAALVLAVAGFGAGYTARASRIPAGEFNALKDEVRTVRQMLSVSLLQQQSAVERLRGVSISLELDRPNPDVLVALTRALEADTSVNVRLSVVDALRSFGSDSRVRDELITALGQQESPLVQIALIDALVELREARSVSALKALAGKADVNDAVRERAAWGVGQLL